MSATSINIVTRDSIFKELSRDMLKEGNKHLLARNYLLGKNWNKDKVRFLYQYLNLLSDFSCDIETYFNSKLKEELNIDSDTILCTDEIIVDNDQYSLSIHKTESTTLVAWFLKCLDQSCPEPQESI